MARVTDMIKMYNHPQLKPVGSNTTNTARKWPAVSTAGAAAVNKPPPPMAPKPKPSLHPGNSPSMNRSAVSFGSADRSPRGSSSLPPWKQQQEEKENSSIPLWKQRQLDKEKQQEQNRTQSNDIPLWKQRQNEKENSSIPAWRKQQMDKEKQSEKPLIPLWKQKQMEREEQSQKDDTVPSWKRPVSNSSNEKNPNLSAISNRFNQNANQADVIESSTTPSWKTRQHQSPSDQSKKPPPFMKNGLGFNGNQPTRNNIQNKSFTANSPATKPFIIERSSGSLGNRSPTFPPPPNEIPSDAPNFPPPPNEMQGNAPNFPPPPNEMSELPPPPKQPPRIRSSFLHTKSPTKPNEPSTNETGAPPPTPPVSRKPSTRVNGVPRQLPLPREVYSQPPPIKTSKPPSVRLPTKSKKKKLPPLPPVPVVSPSLASRPLPSPAPVASRQLPPPPSSTPILPSPILRDLPRPPSRDFPGLPIPSRNELPLPPPPGEQSGKKSPSPMTGLITKTAPLPPPPSVTPDDIYDDAGMDEAPALPPPIRINPGNDTIPQWDDEEDNIYDETPEEPAIPSGFPMPGAQQPIEEDGGELYEDVEEYMRLKRQQQSGSISSADGKKDEKKDKKKKETDKKDKENRKKFKLQKEGDIVSCGHATVNETCKGGGWSSSNLAVTAGESIEVIRMGDNPKGKWLVRNAEGSYGYVDSDKVTINIDQLRSTFGVAGGQGGRVPEMIPTDDDEVIYDATADEDLYEEF